MAETQIVVNQRSYLVYCDDGQEQYLAQLAAKVDAVVQDHRSSLGHIGEVRLFLLASLQIMDELINTQNEIQILRKRNKDVEKRVNNREEIHSRVNNEALASAQHRIEHLTNAISALNEKLDSQSSLNKVGVNIKSQPANEDKVNKKKTV